jgi:hypothetical protein
MTTEDCYGGEWISDAVRAKIEASEAGERESFDTVDAMLRRLRDA